VFPKVNQPSNPSFCCQRDKLYTNPSFVVVFLNPCFSPLYLQVYSDTKSIFIVNNPHKIVTNLAQKIRFTFFPLREFGRRKKPQQNAEKHSQIRALILLCTSRNPILSHFYNNLHLDSKLVMMPNHQPPCCSFPCFPRHQVAPQVYTLTSSTIGMSSALLKILVSKLLMEF